MSSSVVYAQYSSKSEAIEAAETEAHNRVRATILYRNDYGTEDVSDIEVEVEEEENDGVYTFTATANFEEIEHIEETTYDSNTYEDSNDSGDSEDREGDDREKLKQEMDEAFAQEDISELRSLEQEAESKEYSHLVYSAAAMIENLEEREEQRQEAEKLEDGNDGGNGSNSSDSGDSGSSGWGGDGKTFDTETGSEVGDEIAEDLNSLLNILRRWSYPLATIALMIAGMLFWLGDKGAKNRVFQVILGLAIVTYAYSIISTFFS